MTPVFVNSAYVSAPERFVLSGGRWAATNLKVRYGFLDHPGFGPTLIDTGYSQHVTCGASRSIALKAYAAMLRPKLEESGAIDRFLGAHGLKPSDISTIVITHFHADHISALRDFPNAKMLAPKSAMDSVAATGKFANIRHGIFAELLPDDFHSRVEVFENFPLVSLPGSESGRDLFSDGSVVAVEFPGHAPGHSGIWFGRMDQPLLYATDVQWVRRAVTENRIPGFPASRVATDVEAAMVSSRRLQAFAHQFDFLLCHQPEMHRLDWLPVSA